MSAIHSWLGRECDDDAPDDAPGKSSDRDGEMLLRTLPTTNPVHSMAAMTRQVPVNLHAVFMGTSLQPFRTGIGAIP
jgi:hypothetical protein